MTSDEEVIWLANGLTGKHEADRYEDRRYFGREPTPRKANGNQDENPDDEIFLLYTWPGVPISKTVRSESTYFLYS